jgi:23S rRNA (adenine2503-C2)-methyltransferase
MHDAPKDIRDIPVDSLITQLQSLGLPKFRCQQVHDWIWKKNVGSFSEMHNLGNATKTLLASHFFLGKIKQETTQISRDKTIKCAFTTFDHKTIEGVLIPTKKRMTACVSSQAGCSLSCSFCATGKLKLQKNLSAGEIIDQIVYLNRLAQSHYQIPLSNVVLMGMGEPLLNYKNVMEAMHIATSPDGLHMSPRRITLSTAGIAKMIKRLGDDQVKFNLALSLHAANDKKRSEIMEINDSNNLETLREALEYFHEKTDARITFEYILLHGFNDTLEDAAELARFARCVPCKINVIEYNPIEGGVFQKTNPERTDQFVQFLTNKNLIVNVRRSRGKDIDAACGQLANKANLTSPI